MDDEELRQAAAIAAEYQGPADTRLGALSRAVLAMAAEPPRQTAEERRYGLVVDRPTWLADTERTQREVFKLRWDTVAYLRDQVFACMIELGECVQELPWKSARDGLVSQSDRESIHAVVSTGKLEAARKELVDALHFIANAALALGFDDDTLWEEYNRVSCANIDKRRRQEFLADRDGEGPP